jgi:hypothetical protein
LEHQKDVITYQLDPIATQLLHPRCSSKWLEENAVVAAQIAAAAAALNVVVVVVDN